MGIRGMSSLRNKIERAKRKIDRDTTSTLHRTGARAEAGMKRNVVENDAVASTELFRGIGYTVIGGDHLNIFSNAPHSGYVEFGTGPKHVLNPYTRRYEKPDFSPQLVAALTEWAAIKPSVVGNPAIVGRKAALAISGMLDGNPGGTEPQPFFMPVWRKERSRLKARMRQNIRDAF